MIARLFRRFTRAAPPPRLLDRLAQPGDQVWQALFEHAPSGKLLLDRTGRVMRANLSARGLLADAATLASGVPVGLLFDASDRDTVTDSIHAAANGPVPHALPARPFVARLVGAPSEQRLLVSVTALAECDGSISGALLRLRDTSLEARLENQLEHSQRLQVAGQLAGGVSHDFNNLLTAIIGAADAIAVRDGLDAATRDDVAAIRGSADRGASLVRHLLTFGRKQSLAPKVLDVNAVIADLSAVLRRVLPSSVRLELALEQPGVCVLVDPTALDQVLLNLSVNARDAMPGGGTLTLRSGHLSLHRALSRGNESIPPGDYALIEVQDTGRGIPPEVLPHIFDPFFTTRRDLGGHGLGLSTVHGIVRQSDGFLAVDSEPGLGTRMRVYLPQREGVVPVVVEPGSVTRAPEVPARPSAERAASCGPILLVDDEDTVLRITGRALRGRGWQVVSASSAEAALDLLDEQPETTPCVVVTDLVMPGLDGAALVRAVRGRCGDPRLPAILVSGYAAEQLQREVAITLGDGDGAGAGSATRFLAKPYDMRELAACLDELLIPAAVA